MRCEHFLIRTQDSGSLQNMTHRIAAKFDDNSSTEKMYDERRRL